MKKLTWSLNVVVAVLLASCLQKPAHGEVVSTNGFVSQQVSPSGTSNAFNEPTMAVHPDDPDHVVVAWRYFADIASTNAWKVGYAVSTNGGASWTTDVDIDGVSRSDPVVAVSSNGTFFLVTLDRDAGSDETDMFISTNGGFDWFVDTNASGIGGDKPWIAIDNTGGDHHGNLYQVWHDPGSCCGFNDRDEDVYAVRDPGGGWTGPFDGSVAINDVVRYGTMDVTSDGTVLAVGQVDPCIGTFDCDQLHIGIQISRDGGDAWDHGVAVGPDVIFVFPVEDVLIKFADDSSLGSNPNPGANGAVPGLIQSDALQGQAGVASSDDTWYVGGTFLAADLTPSKTQFLMSRTDEFNDGTFWDARNCDVGDTGSNGWEWFGTFDVAPNGRVDAFYNHTTSLTSTSSFTETLYTFSTNGCDWSRTVKVAPTWNSYAGLPKASRKIGDYYAVVSDNDRVHFAYSATPGGEQEVYYLTFEWADCNTNNVLDLVDIYGGTSMDANANGRPDECDFIVDLSVDGLWMYQNLANTNACTLTASASIANDPNGNTSYTYEWSVDLPSDVSAAPVSVGGGGKSDTSWTLAAPSCETNGLSDSGQTHTLNLKVTGDQSGGDVTVSAEFSVALLADVNNDGIVNVTDRSIVGAYTVDGFAGVYTLKDIDLSCDGVADGDDRIISNDVWRGNECSTTGVSEPAEYHDELDVDLTLSRNWMYQNTNGSTSCDIQASGSVVDDPFDNTGYDYDWRIILPNDVSVDPSSKSGGGSGDTTWLLASPSCETNGLSDSGQAHYVLLTVTGDDIGNQGAVLVDFSVVLMADVNNDGIVDVADRSIINAFEINGSAGSFTFEDVDVDCDGVVDANHVDRDLASDVWMGNLCATNGVSEPADHH